MARSPSVIVLLACLLSPGALGRQPLPVNPDVVQGVLANGLRYVIVPHHSAAGAPARVAGVLRIDSGTFDESDDERGSARVCEQLARATAAGQGGAPGAIAPAPMPGGGPSVNVLSRAGVSVAQDLRSTTSYEYTSFSLSVPASDPEVVGAMLGALASILRPPAEDADAPGFESALRQIREQDRAAMGVGLRANADLLPKMMPGSLLSRRMPMGEGTMAPGLSAETVRVYRSRCYTPVNAAVVFAGDLVPAELERRVREVFGRLKGGARPGDPDPGHVMNPPRLALSLADPGMSMDIVQLSRTRAPTFGFQTEPDLLADLRCAVAAQALQRRIERAQGQGACAGAGARAFTGVPMRTLLFSALIVQGSRGSALDAARSAVAYVRAIAGDDPISQVELDSARSEVLASLREYAGKEASFTPDAMAARYAELVTLRGALISAGQRADIAERLLANLTPESVTAEIRESLDPGAACLVALTAGGVPPPDPRLLAEALDAPPAPRSAGNETPGIDPLAQGPSPQGAPGAVVAMEIHPPSGVLSGRLSNGVRFHHRRINPERGQFRLSVCLALPPDQRGDPARGWIQVAAGLLASPALGELDASATAGLLARHALSVGAAGTGDALLLTIAGPNTSVDKAFALTREVLTSARADRAVFEKRKLWVQRTASDALRLPESAITALYLDLVYPPELSRARVPTPDQADALDFEACAQAFDRLVGSAPVEIALTGDVERPAMLGLVAGYLVSVPHRWAKPDRTDPGIVPAPGFTPVRQQLTIESADTRASALEGFRGIDADDPTAALALDVAARVLSSRLLTRLRDELTLSADAAAVNRPGEAFRGVGVGEFWAGASCEPSRLPELRAELRAAMDRLVAGPITETELAAARRRVGAERAERLADMDWWAQRLALRSLRPGPLDDDLAAPGRALMLSEKDVLDAVRSIAVPERFVSLAVTPK